MLVFSGTLNKTEDSYIFLYDEKYLSLNDSTPVSLILTLRKDAYILDMLFPFFDGLIPEGYLLNVVSNNWKKDTKDRFNLLLVTAKDLIGNVSIKDVKDE